MRRFALPIMASCGEDVGDILGQPCRDGGCMPPNPTDLQRVAFGQTQPGVLLLDGLVVLYDLLRGTLEGREGSVEIVCELEELSEAEFGQDDVNAVVLGRRVDKLIEKGASEEDCQLHSTHRLVRVRILVKRLPHDLYRDDLAQRRSRVGERVDGGGVLLEPEEVYPTY